LGASHVAAAARSATPPSLHLLDREWADQLTLGLFQKPSDSLAMPIKVTVDQMNFIQALMVRPHVGKMERWPATCP
jgi:hypothetical protein